MRLFFAMDGDSKFSEMNVVSKDIMKDDYIVCHTEALYHQLKGEQLLRGEDAGKIVLCLGTNLHLEKRPINIVFFTKIPKHISSKSQGDHVIVTASFK